MNQFTHPVGRRSATLTGYVQQTSSALPNLNVCPAVLICPGGGYAYCTDREAEPVALAFLNAGYNAFVLRYTVSTSCPGAEVFDNALAEAEESLIYLHDHAEELHIDPDKIAVLGFSAGAHLTGALGTMGRIRPAALLLGYGVYAADGVAMGVQMPNVLNHIDAQTPPSFLFATQGDRLVPASNSLDFASRLAALHTPYEIHIFSYGDHGASLGTLNVTAPRSHVNPDLAHWFPMALRFLEHIFRHDELVPQPAEATEYGPDMRIGKLLDDPASAPLLAEHLPELVELVQNYPDCRALTLKKFQLFTQTLPQERFDACVKALTALNSAKTRLPVSRGQPRFFVAFLQQRCQHFEQHAQRTEQPPPLPDASGVVFHGAALFQRRLKIRLDVPDAGGIRQPDRIFKVVVQAAVIEVDGAHHGLPVVHDKDFCMNKARRPLADLHPRIQQGRIMGLGQRVRKLFVRDARQDEVDVHTALGGKLQGRFQLAV